MSDPVLEKSLHRDFHPVPSLWVLLTALLGDVNARGAEHGNGVGPGLMLTPLFPTGIALDPNSSVPAHLHQHQLGHCNLDSPVPVTGESCLRFPFILLKCGVESYGDLIFPRFKHLHL